MNHFFKHSKPWLVIPFFLAGLAIAVLMAFVFGYFVMLLWNWLMPAIFGLKVITYWQAWGLVLLSHILFKTGPHFPRGHHFHDREKFKERMKERFGERFNECDREKFFKERFKESGESDTKSDSKKE